MKTTCMRCGFTDMLTTPEAIELETQHGPGKCEANDDVE